MNILPNPLMTEKPPEPISVVDALAGQKAQVTYPNQQRILKKLFRKETAAEAVKELVNGSSIFGFTKGQFSLVELLEAVLDITGPADLTVSTWTAAKTDLSEVLSFIQQGKIRNARFLLDMTFQRRSPELAQSIRQQFGPEAIRLTSNHAKFFLLSNENWKVVCKASMNLNTNDRLEDFDITTEPTLFAFMNGIIDGLFENKKTSNQAKQKCSQIWQGWRSGEQL